jgi:hypothetical protein
LFIRRAFFLWEGKRLLLEQGYTTLRKNEEDFLTPSCVDLYKYQRYQAELNLLLLLLMFSLQQMTDASDGLLLAVTLR